jgi:lactoylglutathione lyase
MASARLLHTMLRVADLEASLDFYVRVLGMDLLRRQDFPEGRFTLAFVGFEPERTGAVIELTHNWDQDRYDRGDAYGHVAVGVADVYAFADAIARRGARIVRPPGPLKGDKSEIIAFAEDPDGYRMELIQRSADWGVG